MAKRGVLFLALKMSPDSVNGVLHLDATVRRSDDDFDRTAAASANANVDIEHALESLLPRAWAQVIAAWRSTGVFTSAFAPVVSALPRLAGVTSRAGVDLG